MADSPRIHFYFLIGNENRIVCINHNATYLLIKQYNNNKHVRMRVFIISMFVDVLINFMGVLNYTFEIIETQHTYCIPFIY